MRKKKLFYTVLVLYIAAIGLFVRAAVENRHKRTLPLLDEREIPVPTLETIRKSMSEKENQKGLVEHYLKAARRQITLKERSRIMEDIEAVGKAGDVIDEKMLDALETRGIEKVSAWDCRMLITFAAQKLTAAEDRKGPDGRPIISAEEILSVQSLFNYLLAHGLTVNAVESGKISLDDPDANNRPVGRILVKGMGSIIGLNATMFMVGVNFLVLVILLYALLWEPMIRLLDERAEKIKTEIETAEEKLRDSEALAEQRKHEFQEAQREREEFRAKGRHEGLEERQKIINTAREEAERLKEHAEAQIAAEEAEAKQKLVSDIGGLSVSLASKILEKEVSEKTHSHLIDKFVKQLGPESDGEAT